MDLDGEYDGDTFVLYTASDTIYRSLTKAEHSALIGQALEEIGVDNFELRLRGKKTDDFQKNLNAIKETFGGVKVDVK
jgi:hypothetical protein